MAVEDCVTYRTAFQINLFCGGLLFLKKKTFRPPGGGGETFFFFKKAVEVNSYPLNSPKSLKIHLRLPNRH